MKHQALLILLIFLVPPALGQERTSKTTQKNRLDFARTYVEFGGSAIPSFTGKRLAGNSLAGNSVVPFQHSASIQPYISWGGFHFWGHAEFYVSFPLTRLNVHTSNQSDFRYSHSVVTGARYLPWSIKKNTVRPYLGLSWSALEFMQRPTPEEEQPTLSKDFRLVGDVGLLYGSERIKMRIGISYLHSNTWMYPISRTTLETIDTPKVSAQLGFIYSFDSTQNEDSETIARWNSHPPYSRLGSTATRVGDFFVSAGPSTSFSLSTSVYNKENFPFLNDQTSSNSYFDLGIGYQWNEAGWFTAMSFRNPEFETKGYGVKQTIKKTSVAFELNAFLVDYSGFAPFIGMNLAYDHLHYVERREDLTKELTFNRFEPGLTIGWDILPGKTEEHLILRTNVRWYPFSSFEIEGQSFAFSQLEYNLIQAVFYPGRLFASKQ